MASLAGPGAGCPGILLRLFQGILAAPGQSHPIAVFQKRKRDGFADAVQSALEAAPLVEIRREEIAALPDAAAGETIIATGPLTSPGLAASIRALTGEDALAFFDAIAPIVHRDTIDLEVAWFQSRYDKQGPGGTGSDYINCPLDSAQYERFVAAQCLSRASSRRGFAGTSGMSPLHVASDRG